MIRRNTPPQRIDPDFAKEMKEVAKIRLNKNLANFSPRDLSLAEMTRLLRRTNGYQISLEELKTKPKSR